MFLNPDVFSTEDRLPGSLGDEPPMQPKKPTSGGWISGEETLPGAAGSGSVTYGANPRPVSAQDKFARQRELEEKKRRERQQASGMVTRSDGPRVITVNAPRPGSAAGKRPANGQPLRFGESRSSSSASAATTMVRNLHDTDDEDDGVETIKSLDSEDSGPKKQEFQKVAVASSTQQNMKAQGLSTEFDPTTAKSGGGAAAAGTIMSVPQSIDTSDLRTFLLQPLPRGKTMQCYIKRVKAGIKRMFPTYCLFLNEGDKFVLAARKRKKNKTSNYLISLDDDDLARKSGNFFGKVRSNFIGTEFTIYDRGANPMKKEKNDGTLPVRQELGTIIYEHNVLGTRGPRKMTVVLPKVDENGVRAQLQPTHQFDSIAERFKRDLTTDMDVFINKPPKWNDQLGAYCLNFNGRVTVASVKNFQLANANDLDRVVLQFGKVRDDCFTMDYSYPLCALQAFGASLTSFDNKLACE